MSTVVTLYCERLHLFKQAQIWFSWTSMSISAMDWGFNPLFHQIISMTLCWKLGAHGCISHKFHLTLDSSNHLHILQLNCTWMCLEEPTWIREVLCHSHSSDYPRLRSPQTHTSSVWVSESGPHRWWREAATVLYQVLSASINETAAEIGSFLSLSCHIYMWGEHRLIKCIAIYFLCSEVKSRLPSSITSGITSHLSPWRQVMLSSWACSYSSGDV